MNAIPFKEQNTIVAKDQPQYNSLPALIKNTPEGEVISCWGLSLKERLILLFTGKLWMQLLMFRNAEGKINPITPSLLTVNKSDVIYDKPVLGINFDVLQSALREAKKKYPNDTKLVIIIHDDLYDNKGVDIPVTEERLGGTTILRYSDAKNHIELPSEFNTDNFLIVESFFY